MNVAPANNGATTAAQNKKWTVLLYSASDNDLKPYMLDDINEIETVGSDAYTNLIAQVDEGRGKGATRYMLEKDGDPNRINSPVLQQLGSTNMSDPASLADFVEWGIKNYPSEHVMVVLSDHGDGWKGALQDYSHNGWMDLKNIREGLEEAQRRTGKKIDVLGFDACLMASTEVAHELKDTADYLIASEETEGVDGWHYTNLLNPNLLKNLKQMQMLKINVEPRELAVLGVRSAEAKQGVLPTMSAVDMAKVPGVVAAVDRLGRAIVNTTDDVGILKDISSETQEFTGYKDAYDFAGRVQTSVRVKDMELRRAAREVKDAVRQAVIAEEHSDEYPNAHGLTLEISRWGTPSGYTDTKFGQETSWPQALDKLGGS
ncbi:MAG: hypothetical protein FJX76_15000 [Armatimonadetes bacterium]|nr:hypothetical protein [Armatimonadota bacterium]